jgi:hypothetical protein
MQIYCTLVLIRLMLKTKAAMYDARRKLISVFILKRVMFFMNFRNIKVWIFTGFNSDLLSMHLSPKVSTCQCLYLVFYKFAADFVHSYCRKCGRGKPRAKCAHSQADVSLLRQILYSMHIFNCRLWPNPQKALRKCQAAGRMCSLTGWLFTAAATRGSGCRKSWSTWLLHAK